MTSQVLVGLCNYPLVNVYSLLLNMAIETVDFPMNAIFQFVMSDSSPKSNFHRRDVRLLYRKNVPCIPLVPSYIPTPYLLVYQTNYLFPTHSPYFPHILPIFSPYVPHISHSKSGRDTSPVAGNIAMAGFVLEVQQDGC